jgi:hypothetical protein
MQSPVRHLIGLAASLALVASGAGVLAQGRGGGMRGGMMSDPTAQADMALFHELFAHRSSITRTVTLRTDGVETLTESADPAVAAKIRAHVEAMAGRVREGRPIHQRDPLFREVFANAAAIDLKVEPTGHGVRTVETSGDAYVVKLIQAHAEVVSAFIRNGQAEAMKDHAVPSRGKERP